MNPGLFTTLTQVKYTMDSKLRPYLHNKVLSIMMMLEETGFGYKRGKVFYKSPYVTQDMTKKYDIDILTYMTRLTSRQCKYGVTKTSSENYNMIHRTIFSNR